MGTHKQNPKSLENLKLGAQSRYQGKIRVTATLLPSTKAWLEQNGNLSKRIDEIADQILAEELVDRKLLVLAEQRIQELENQLDDLIQMAGRLQAYITSSAASTPSVDSTKKKNGAQKKLRSSRLN